MNFHAITSYGTWPFIQVHSAFLLGLIFIIRIKLFETVKGGGVSAQRHQLNTIDYL